MDDENSKDKTNNKNKQTSTNQDQETVDRTGTEESNQNNLRRTDPTSGHNPNDAREEMNAQPTQQQQGARRLTTERQQQQRPVVIILKEGHNSAFNPFLLPLQRGEAIKAVPVGRDPTRIKCPVCKKEVLTMVIHEPKHPKCLLCFLLCTLPCCCCCWPCVCLPYCMDSCQNANHYCPNCNSYVGTFEN